MSCSPKNVLSSRIAVLLGTEAADSIAEYVSGTFQMHDDKEGDMIQIQSYLEDLLGESPAVSDMAREYVILLTQNIPQNNSQNSQSIPQNSQINNNQNSYNQQKSNQNSGVKSNNSSSGMKDQPYGSRNNQTQSSNPSHSSQSSQGGRSQGGDNRGGDRGGSKVVNDAGYKQGQQGGQGGQGGQNRGGNNNNTTGNNNYNGNNNGNKGSSNTFYKSNLSFMADTIAANMKMGPNPGKVCGCMGTRHKLAGSCVSCGRVSCEMEIRYGDQQESERKDIDKATDTPNKPITITPISQKKTQYHDKHDKKKKLEKNNENSKDDGIEKNDKNEKVEKKKEIVDLQIPSGTILCNCFTCGSIVCSPMNGQDLSLQGSQLDLDTMKAYKQKDKLLVFDREHAKRTHVHDAQADYYETGTWLSEEEKKEMDEREQKKRDARRPLNRKFKMAFDFAGRRIIEQIEEEEVEEIVDIADDENTIYTCKGTENMQDDYYSNMDNENDDDDNDDDGDDNSDDRMEGRNNNNIKKEMNYTSHKNKNKISENDNKKISEKSNNIIPEKGEKGVNNFEDDSEKNCSENIPENFSKNVPGPVVQVIENEMLNYDKGQAGDVYRSIRNSMAVRASKRGKEAKKEKN